MRVGDLIENGKNDQQELNQGIKTTLAFVSVLRTLICRDRYYNGAPTISTNINHRRLTVCK